MKQAHLIISGYVQGVWYRKFVKTNAVTLGLTGWVRNLPASRLTAPAGWQAGTTNGKVEAVLQGEQDKIEEIIKLCHDGPEFAEVKKVDVEWEEIKEEFRDFSIL